MAPGARTGISRNSRYPWARRIVGAPIFEPKVFLSKSTVLKKVLVIFWGIFGPLAVIRQLTMDDLGITATEISHSTRFTLLLLLRIQC